MPHALDLYAMPHVDAFTAEGLSESTKDGSSLANAMGSLSAHGLVLVNLHTGDTDDPDYYICRRILRLLCGHFESVYALTCVTTQNLIAICHQGDFVDLDQWRSRIVDALALKGMRAACAGLEFETTMSRFDLVGGKKQPMSDDDDDYRAEEARVMRRR